PGPPRPRPRRPADRPSHPSPRGPRVLAVQLRHLLPEWQEILGVPAVSAAGAGELALVHPPAVPARDPRSGELLGALDLPRARRDHLPLRDVALEHVVHRRILEL